MCRGGAIRDDLGGSTGLAIPWTDDIPKDNLHMRVLIFIAFWTYILCNGRWRSEKYERVMSRLSI